MLEQGSYDVIFLDIRMPGMSGMELYDRIIRKQPELTGKVIFITGDTSDASVRENLVSHNLTYMTKPFDRKTIEEKVNALLSVAEKQE